MNKSRSQLRLNCMQTSLRRPIVSLLIVFACWLAAPLNSPLAQEPAIFSRIKAYENLLANCLMEYDETTTYTSDGLDAGGPVRYVYRALGSRQRIDYQIDHDPKRPGVKRTTNLISDGDKVVRWVYRDGSAGQVTFDHHSELSAGMFFPRRWLAPFMYYHGEERGAKVEEKNGQFIVRWNPTDKPEAKIRIKVVYEPYGEYLRPVSYQLGFDHGVKVIHDLSFNYRAEDGPTGLAPDGIELTFAPMDAARSIRFSLVDFSPELDDSDFESRISPGQSC